MRRPEIRWIVACGVLACLPTANVVLAQVSSTQKKPGTGSFLVNPNSSGAGNLGGFNNNLPSNTANNAPSPVPSNNNAGRNNNAAQLNALGAALGSALRNSQQQGLPSNGNSRQQNFSGGNASVNRQFNNGSFNNGSFSQGQPLSTNSQQLLSPPVTRVPSSPGAAVVVQPQSTAGVRVSGDPPPPPKKVIAQGILITCPEGTDGSCHYELLNTARQAYPYDIAAGEKQNLNESGEWTLRYTPGAGQVPQTYKLRGGKEYRLQKDDQGLWQLYMETLPPL